MREIYVIRPMVGAAEEMNVPTAQEIVDQHQAVGFIGRLALVQACGRIVINDGNGFVRIANIKQFNSTRLPTPMLSMNTRVSMSHLTKWSRLKACFFEASKPSGGVKRACATLRFEVGANCS